MPKPKQVYMYIVCRNDAHESPPPQLIAGHFKRSAAIRHATAIAKQPLADANDHRKDTDSKPYTLADHWEEVCAPRRGEFTRSGGDEAIWVQPVPLII